RIVVDRNVWRLTIATLCVFTLHLVYGAFMAGYKAASAASTWPDINGEIIPSHMSAPGQGMVALVENRIAIHFIHRGLAYVLLIMIILLTVRLVRNYGRKLGMSAWWPGILVTAQVLLGILTVLYSLRIVPNQWGVFE